MVRQIPTLNTDSFKITNSLKHQIMLCVYYYSSCDTSEQLNTFYLISSTLLSILVSLQLHTSSSSHLSPPNYQLRNNQTQILQGILVVVYSYDLRGTHSKVYKLIRYQTSLEGLCNHTHNLLSIATPFWSLELAPYATI